MASRACCMWRWSLSGSFASDFFADFVTSSVQFIVEGFKGDVFASLVFGKSSGDGLLFCFCRRVEREAAFIGLCGGVDSDGALAYGERDQIAWLDAGFFGDGLWNGQARFFNKYGHGKKLKKL